jgi:hypothetical protein
MITVNGRVFLSDVGADERIFEGVYANVSVTFTKGHTILGDEITFSPEATEYIESLGTVQHWVNEIRDDFENSGDFVLDHIVEDLDAEEYAKAETYITAYYQDKPMPDGLGVEIDNIRDFIS